MFITYSDNVEDILLAMEQAEHFIDTDIIYSKICIAFAIDKLKEIVEQLTIDENEFFDEMTAEEIDEFNTLFSDDTKADDSGIYEADFTPTEELESED